MSWCQRNLRETAAVVVCFTAILFGVNALPACSLFTSQNAKTVLDFATIACVIANAASDDVTVANVCNIADDLIPDLQKLLAEQRKSARKMACHPDIRTDGGQ